MLAALLIMVAGCAPSQETTPAPLPDASPNGAEQPDPWPVFITDDQLQPIAFSTDAREGDERILALAVGSAEIVELLGAGDQLVGRDETSAIPEEVPVVTQGHQVEIEDALALSPTLVLVDDLSGPPEAIDALSAAGARVIDVPSVWTLDDVQPRVEAVATGIGLDTQVATELADALTPDSVVPSQESPRVAFLYLRGPSAVYLLGGANTGADALIASAGAVDVGAEQGYDGFVPLTAEAIAQADPDVFLVMADGLGSVGGVDGLLELPGIAQTAAATKQQIVVVDDRTLLSFGSRTPALVQRLNEAFAQVSP